MSRFRQLTLLSAPDSARLAVRFPRTALHMLGDCVAGTAATPFPRRLGLFLTNRCDFACPMCAVEDARDEGMTDRKSTRLNSSHLGISYAVFCLKKKKK